VGARLLFLPLRARVREPRCFTACHPWRPPAVILPRPASTSRFARTTYGWMPTSAHRCHFCQFCWWQGLKPELQDASDHARQPAASGHHSIAYAGRELGLDTQPQRPYSTMLLVHGRARTLGRLACCGIAHAASRFVRCVVHIIRCSLLLLHVAAGDHCSRGLCPSFSTYPPLISCFCVILSLS